MTSACLTVVTPGTHRSDEFQARTRSVYAAMATSATPVTAVERELLGAARDGDQDAYRRLVEPHRRELHAHCYRMLGSVHDAEDALQDALLRAWRGLPRFEGRSSLRSWLYKIATNACLNAVARRPKRVLPIDHGPPADPHDHSGAPLVDSVWVEPYPDERLELEDGRAAPEARYERRESVELAFVAALQHLPPNQRAVLILREVLGFSGQEIAEALETTVAAVNSAMQRARRAVDERLPAQSQQATLRVLGDQRLREVVEGYMDAMGRGDVDAVVAMLAQDAAWSMPPLQSWYRGRDEIAVFLATAPLNGEWRWRHVPARASGQAAVGAYVWDADEETYRPFALDVLSLRGELIAEITSFIARTPRLPEGGVLRWPDHPADPAQLLAYFGRFGLPERLD
jgi:RNA polymerase sigma-70 factor, ECF subfamily